MTAPPRDVLDRLPHRPPFRFVTEVTLLQPRAQAAGVWTIRGDESFFAGHFPGNPIVPGVLIAESLAQLAGLIVGPDAADRAFEGRLAQVDLRFAGAVVPPSTIALHATLTRIFGSVFQFDVNARLADQTVANGSIVLSDASART